MTTVAVAAPPRNRRLDLSTQVLLGLGAGAATGLFIGERASVLQICADAYVQLLQMTVLPYVAMSLVGGLGSLNHAVAARLGSRFAVLMVALWGVALLAGLAFPLLLPACHAASLFDPTLLDDAPPLRL